MAQERVQKQKGTRPEQDEAQVETASQADAELDESTEEALANIDDVLEDQENDELLADIDDVLEEDAQAFVENFVQQGGE